MNRPLPQDILPAVDLTNTTGGIDFTSVELRYLTETQDGEIGTALRAVPSPVPSTRDWANIGELPWNSLMIWIALPASSFWVNLNPNEPDLFLSTENGSENCSKKTTPRGIAENCIVRKRQHSSLEKGNGIVGATASAQDGIGLAASVKGLARPLEERRAGAGTLDADAGRSRLSRWPVAAGAEGRR